MKQVELSTDVGDQMLADQLCHMLNEKNNVSSVPFASSKYDDICSS